MSYLKKSKIIHTSQGPVEYHIEGTGKNVLVAIHGTPGNFLQSGYIFYGLEKENYRRLSWSRPGYLNTPLNDNTSIEKQTNLLVALLNALKIENVIILGFSCGCQFGLDFAVRYPDRLNAMILDSPVAFSTDMTPVNPIKKIIDIILLSNPLTEFYSLINSWGMNLALKILIFRLSTCSYKESRKLAKQLIADRNKAMTIFNYIIKPLYPFKLNKKGYLNDKNIFINLNKCAIEKINKPVLIVHGTSDGDVPFEHGKYLASSIPDSEFYPVENAIHLNLVNDEKNIIDKKISFLKKYTQRY